MKDARNTFRIRSLARALSSDSGRGLDNYCWVRQPHGSISAKGLSMGMSLWFKNGRTLDRLRGGLGVHLEILANFSKGQLGHSMA